MRKDIFPYREITSGKSAITRFIKVMRKWDPNNISKVKKRLCVIIISVGLSHGQSYKILSVDSKKKKALIYSYNKNKFKTVH